MVRQPFEDELSELKNEVLRMGSFVEGMLDDALDALLRQDVAKANEVIRADDVADGIDLGIEARCMRLLALQQPMARDLRLIGSAFKIDSDLERIGDHAVDIARAAKALAGQPYFKPLVDIPRLAALAKEMMHNSLLAFVRMDLALVQKVVQDDDEVDNLYHDLIAELVDYMKRDPATVEQATQLLLVARLLERVADHAVNVAERVQYVETGRLKQIVPRHLG